MLLRRSSPRICRQTRCWCETNSHTKGRAGGTCRTSHASVMAWNIALRHDKRAGSARNHNTACLDLAKPWARTETEGTRVPVAAFVWVVVERQPEVRLTEIELPDVGVDAWFGYAHSANAARARAQWLGSRTDTTRHNLAYMSRRAREAHCAGCGAHREWHSSRRRPGPSLAGQTSEAGGSGNQRAVRQNPRANGGNDRGGRELRQLRHMLRHSGLVDLLTDP